ncbi:outer membrane protein assembly factor BamB [Legionella jordanis]|uniref:Outer membrane protein assembly factor BamB n=1 Tax=Legionella jordanis TaxID=456 RepID=A0A0W0VB99_9GAMM|nr:outer membrane protein assembly factor BamB [Legionella jordanis]KTD17181.1 PQQ (pyrrolo quinoline) WD40-like repeat, enzyme repeat domain protein [Legionella jordanis]RMX03302.1 outer membrane protein assembly factor BamB [Legionella jordanis]VEH12621.1 PQQ (pyrrolo quinoline) WD40-like repeat, enzyme repeat domain protein [Legionella jordanis]HAT8713305.1 outer membrane protein assembly factor BamB [Legionella jordanis]
MKTTTLIFSSLILLLPACTHLDNYMLGKDNTPTPAELQPIQPKVKLKQKWSLPVNGKTSANHLRLKPEIVGNNIYTADANGLVEAVNKTTGKVIWSKKLPSGIVSGPAVSPGFIALATDKSTVLLLKQEDGSDLWDAKVSSEVLAKPIITHGKVIAKTIDGNLYALDLSSGKQLWVSEHGAPSLILKASSSPVVLPQNNMILVGYSDGKMDAVDLQTGRLIWQRSIAYASGASDVERLIDIDADPIVRGNIAYLASYQGYVGALSLTDGEFLWRKPASVYKNMAIDDHALYLTDSEDVVWSINRQNGQVNWKQVGLKARGLTEPVVMGSRLIVGDKTGLIHVLACSTGDFISREQLGSAITTTPSISNGNIYVMTSNGRLNRFSVS